MNNIYIGLGSNLGDSAQILNQSVQLLQQHSEIECLTVSSYYCTQPVGQHAGERYLNAAAQLETSLPPFALLDVLQETEVAFGRERTHFWRPRTLDLDLLLYEQEVITTQRLTLPHPACWYRRFVLDPLQEIAPDMVHPVKDVSISQLQQRLLSRPFVVGMIEKSPVDTDALHRHILQQFTQVNLKLVQTDADQSNLKNCGLLFWFGGAISQWDALPVLPRLDLSQSGDQLESDVDAILQSALDDPQRLPAH